MIDPYLYPGTDVLRNKEHITDARELEAFERMATANRMETLPDDIPVTVGRLSRDTSLHLSGGV
jgi:fido (protein-threonine AMPylation protein)